MSGVKHLASALLHHHSSHEEEQPVGPEVIEEEKHFVAQFADSTQNQLAPEEIKTDPRHKKLGGSSRGLSVHDFDLIKTLGTGACAHI